MLDLAFDIEREVKASFKAVVVHALQGSQHAVPVSTAQTDVTGFL